MLHPTLPCDELRQPVLNILCVADGDVQLSPASARVPYPRPTDYAEMVFPSFQSAAATLSTSDIYLRVVLLDIYEYNLQ